MSDFLRLRRPADTLYGSRLLVGGRGDWGMGDLGRGDGERGAIWHYFVEKSNTLGVCACECMCVIYY